MKPIYVAIAVVIVAILVLGGVLLLTEPPKQSQASAPIQTPVLQTTLEPTATVPPPDTPTPFPTRPGPTPTRAPTPTINSQAIVGQKAFGIVEAGTQVFAEPGGGLIETIGQRGVVEIEAHTADHSWYKRVGSGWLKDGTIQIYSSREEAQNVISPRPSPTPSPTPPEITRPPLDLSGTTTYNQMGMTFAIKIDYTNYIGQHFAGASGKYAILSMSITNNSKYSTYVFPGAFTLLPSKGYFEAIDSNTFSLDNPLRNVELQPGSSTSGQVVFLIPKDSGPGTLFFESESFWIVINLQS